MTPEGNSSRFHVMNKDAFTLLVQQAMQICGIVEIRARDDELVGYDESGRRVWSVETRLTAGKDGN